MFLKQPLAACIKGANKFTLSYDAHTEAVSGSDGNLVVRRKAGFDGPTYKMEMELTEEQFREIASDWPSDVLED